MVKLLSEVDFLFLDDLGKESRKADTRRNEWAHQICIDNRIRPIIQDLEQYLMISVTVLYQVAFSRERQAGALSILLG